MNKVEKRRSFCSIFLSLVDHLGCPCSYGLREQMEWTVSLWIWFDGVGDVIADIVRGDRPPQLHPLCQPLVLWKVLADVRCPVSRGSCPVAGMGTTGKGTCNNYAVWVMKLWWLLNNYLCKVFFFFFLLNAINQHTS